MLVGIISPICHGRRTRNNFYKAPHPLRRGHITANAALLHFRAPDLAAVIHIMRIGAPTRLVSLCAHGSGIAPVDVELAKEALPALSH